MARTRRLVSMVVVVALAAAGLAGCSRDSLQVTTTFADVGDLQERHSVQVADVRVGEIDSITLTEDFQAKVVMSLKPGVDVPKRSIAVLRTTSLLGEKFVELRPIDGPGKGPFLADGDVVEQTMEAPELEFVAQQAVNLLGSVAATDVATLVEAGAQAFSGRQTELRTVITNLATISNTLAERSNDITRIIDALGSTSSTLADGAPELTTLLTNLADTTRVLVDNRERAIVALDQLSRLAGVQNDLLVKYRADIDRQIKQADAIIAIAAGQTAEVANLIDWLSRFTTAVPKVIPNEFTQVYMWVVPAEQDPRVEH